MAEQVGGGRGGPEPDRASARLRTVRAVVRWWRPALLVLLASAAIGVAIAVGVPSVAEVRDWVAGAGWAGPVVYAVVYAGLALTPVPVSVLTFAGGVLLGFGWGVPAALAGAFTGALVGFLLARRLGRSSMVRLQERGGRGAGRLVSLDELLRRRGVLAVIGVRLAPVLPFAVLNMAWGLTAVRLRDFVIGSVIGIAPGSTALVAIGAYGGEPGSWPFLLSLAGLGILAAVGAVVTRRRRSPEGS